MPSSEPQSSGVSTAASSATTLATGNKSPSTPKNNKRSSSLSSVAETNGSNTKIAAGLQNNDHEASFSGTTVAVPAVATAQVDQQKLASLAATGRATFKQTSGGRYEYDIPTYHPHSTYEEPWIDPYLTLFDVHRHPRKVIDCRTSASVAKQTIGTAVTATDDGNNKSEAEQVVGKIKAHADEMKQQQNNKKSKKNGRKKRKHEKAGYTDNGDYRMTLPIKLFKNEFQCPICLGYIKKTSIVMECLHRFCYDCISKCLRLCTKKQCPSCRINIPTRRALRFDPNFDLLIKKIIGNDLVDIEQKELDTDKATLIKNKKIKATSPKKSSILNDFEAGADTAASTSTDVDGDNMATEAEAAAATTAAESEAVIATSGDGDDNDNSETVTDEPFKCKFCKKIFTTKYGLTYHVKKVVCEEHRLIVKERRESKAAEKAAAARSLPAQQQQQQSEWQGQQTTDESQFLYKPSQLIDFILRRHPQERKVDRLRREYIRTNKNITVRVLKSFLSKKLSYDHLDDFQILVSEDAISSIINKNDEDDNNSHGSDEDDHHHSYVLLDDGLTLDDIRNLYVSSYCCHDDDYKETSTTGTRQEQERHAGKEGSHHDDEHVQDPEQQAPRPNIQNIVLRYRVVKNHNEVIKNALLKEEQRKQQIKEEEQNGKITQEEVNNKENKKDKEFDYSIIRHELLQQQPLHKVTAQENTNRNHNTMKIITDEVLNDNDSNDKKYDENNRENSSDKNNISSTSSVTPGGTNFGLADGGDIEKDSGGVDCTDNRQHQSCSPMIIDLRDEKEVNSNNLINDKNATAHRNIPSPVVSSLALSEQETQVDDGGSFTMNNPLANNANTK